MFTRVIIARKRESLLSKGFLNNNRKKNSGFERRGVCMPG